MESSILRSRTGSEESRLRLLNLFEAAPDPIFIVDQRGIIIEVNTEAGRAFGYPVEDMVGRTIEFLVPEARRGAHAQMRESYLHEPERRPMGLGLDLEARRKDGSTFPVDITLGPFNTPEGRYVAAIVRDITDRRAAEVELGRRAAALEEARAELKVRNALLSSILESMGEAVVVADRAGHVTLANSEARRLHGTDDTGVPSHEWPERYGLFTADGTRRLAAEEVPLFRALQGEHVDDAEILVRGAGNPTGAFVTATARPVVGEGGSPEGAVVIFRDMSERKHADEELARRASELADANAELEAFAYSVSHDLRTPLRAMQGLGMALEEDCADQLQPEGREYLRRIVAAAKRMDTLILDLLAYTRVGRGAAVHQTVDLDPVFRGVADEAGGSQEGLVVHAPLGWVRGNPAMVRQIASNLVANAFKFVARGTEPRVEVRSEFLEGRIRVRVSDNGIGIEPAHQARIFGIFERLHGIEQYPGTGIGLALVKKATESMNGSVGVESSLGNGSSFWFELESADVQ